MKGDMRKVGLVSSIYLIGVMVGLVLLIVAGLNQASIVKAQQPCDNVTQYLENKGYIEQPYDVIKIQTDITLVNESFTYVALAPGESIFWVACSSGRVFTHKPSISEVLVANKPDNIGDELFIRMKTGPPDQELPISIFVDSNITPSQIEQINQSVAQLRMVAEIRAVVNMDQYEAISKFDWGYIQAKTRPAVFNETEIKIVKNPGLVLTDEHIDQVKRTGAEIQRVDIAFGAVATPDQLEELSNVEGVKHIIYTPLGTILPEKGTIFGSRWIYISLAIIIIIILWFYNKRIKGGR